jgi:hypothetical protein
MHYLVASPFSKKLSVWYDLDPAESRPLNEISELLCVIQIIHVSWIEISQLPRTANTGDSSIASDVQYC